MWKKTPQLQRLFKDCRFAWDEGRYEIPKKKKMNISIALFNLIRYQNVTMKHGSICFRIKMWVSVLSVQICTQASTALENSHISAKFFVLAKATHSVVWAVTPQ